MYKCKVWDFLHDHTHTHTHTHTHIDCFMYLYEYLGGVGCKVFHIVLSVKILSV